jgi:hypothetical protein
MMFLPLEFNESFEFRSIYSGVKNVNSWNLESHIILVPLYMIIASFEDISQLSTNFSEF